MNCSTNLQKIKKQMQIAPHVKTLEYKKLKNRGRSQDDIIVTLMMVPYWHIEFINNGDNLLYQWNFGK